MKSSSPKNSQQLRKSVSKSDIGYCSTPVGKTHPILQKYFGYCLYKAAMRFRGLMDDALKTHDLLTPQLGILRVIQESKRLSQQDIGDFVGTDKASMVKFIDQLEKLKLLKREAHETDRRMKMISLTLKGAKMLDEVSLIRQKVETLFLEGLTLDEQAQIKKIIPKLLP